MVDPGDPLPPQPGRAPVVEDDFTGALRSNLWIAHYLPHWTTPDRSAARLEHVPGGLALKIEEDQLDWRAEDAPLRVSNLQTGTFSGEPGSLRGTHRHRPDGLHVRTATPTQLLWAPSAGRIDLSVSATRDSGCMLAAWLVGTEHLDEQAAGEVCLFEIDADAIDSTTWARTGIKAHADPDLHTDMTEVELPFDATRPHTWTVIWGAGETLIGCEGTVLRHFDQAPAYPLFLMIDLFEIGPPQGTYPKAAIIHHLRGWDSA
ncbi:hypothetical protein [Kocuria arenosa]|uniref:hypothetical protein n=1 Tax=Kocuria arenosa TaxID=3071446 RepID=UPI0034D45502